MIEMEVRPVVLEGARVRLEPLAHEVADELRRPRVGEHPFDLGIELGAELVLACKPDQLVVGQDVQPLADRGAARPPRRPICHCDAEVRRARAALLAGQRRRRHQGHRRRRGNQPHIFYNSS